MFVLEITETQMQIEVNEYAARLRLKHTEIKCFHMTAADLANFDLREHDESECPDCGDCIVCCRCCPGEG